MFVRRFADADSGIYIKQTELPVDLKIYKNGQFLCEYDFNANGEKAFDEGEYELEWTVRDALERVTVKTVKFSVVYSDIRFADGISEKSTADRNSEISVKADDVIVWDYASEGGKPYRVNIVVEISENGGAFKKYDGEKLKIGEYEIRYTVTPP